MNREREAGTWLEAMGGLSDYLGDDDDDNHAPSNSADANSLAVDIKLDHNNTEASTHTNSQSSERRQHSVDETAADAATTASRSPAVSQASLRRYSQQVDELQARVLSRALAYESLAQTTSKSNEPASPEEDLNQQPQHPLSLRPGSTPPISFTAASEGREATLLIRRSSFNDWKPQKPVYAQPNSFWESKSDSGYGGVPYIEPLSRYEAYRPPPPPPLQENPQPESHRLKFRPPPPMRDVSNENNILSDYSDVTYSYAPRSAEPISRSGGQPSLIATHPDLDYFNNRHSAQPAFAKASASSVSTEMGRGRQMPPPSPSSPSIASPFPPATPTPRSDRSPSPSRGAWTADRPRQPRASFLERAKRRMNRSLQLNLQRAGVRPKSSFEVRRVQKSPVADMFAPEQWPSGEHGALSELDSMETESRESQSWSVDSSGLEERMRRHRQRKLQQLQHQQEQQQNQQQQQQQQHTPELLHEMDASEDSWARRRSLDLSRRDSLFLEGGDGGLSTPTSDSFFASEWSQQQVILQAQETVASLSPSSPFHNGPFGTNQPQAPSNAAQQTNTPPIPDPTSSREPVAVPDPYLAEAPDDDRGFLPSRYRENIVQAIFLASSEPLTESPEPIEPAEPAEPPHRVLTRKRGTRHLRCGDKLGSR
ncbi:hypothetical protein F4776DRAFT_606702 [Hypoxylon sp. NC0597]|nr:hypothetical protein F4776DRAFT_606702 [Hypoxylon sp. NC0597]